MCDVRHLISLDDSFSDCSSISSSNSSGPSKSVSRFCSPFKSRKRGKNPSSFDGLLDELGLGQEELINREELLQLYILKLDEEANYFKVSTPVEEEFCDCSKCQVRANYLFIAT